MRREDCGTAALEIPIELIEDTKWIFGISSAVHDSTLGLNVSKKGEPKKRSEYTLKLCDQVFIYRTNSLKKGKRKLKDKNHHLHKLLQQKL